MRFPALVGLTACLVVASFPGHAQDVVSAQSGVIHYMEGAVLVDDVPIDHKPSSYPLVKDGSVLRTAKGRAEVMLTPGVFLRLDENSSIKMLSSVLTATSIEFSKGSVILDALDAQGNIPVQLKYKEASVKFSKPGLYRIDSDTEVLQTYSGLAVVKQEDKETQVDESRLYFFELATDTKKFDDGTEDEFLDWARNRNQQIEAENQATQADANNDDADANSPLAAPFNYNAPLGGLGNSPSLPNYGDVYPYSVTPLNPYGAFFVNSYAPTMLYPLPPLVVPAFIYVGRRWPTHPVNPTWPHSNTWPTIVHPPWTPASGIHITTPHTTVGTYIHPNVTTRPMVVPHVSTPAVHAGPHR